jgi:hypothetical protein
MIHLHPNAPTVINPSSRDGGRLTWGSRRYGQEPVENRNTAILAVPASGRPDRFFEAVEATATRHRRDVRVPLSVFNRLLEMNSTAK